MNQGRTVFSQLVEFLPTYQFQICVDRYQGNRYVKDFSCWDQFLCLAPLLSSLIAKAFAISKLVSVLQQPKLYHMGFRGQVSRNTLAHANEHRDWRIYADFAQALDCRRSRSLPRRIFWSGAVREPCMPSTRRLSICVCRFSRGGSSAAARVR